MLSLLFPVAFALIVGWLFNLIGHLIIGIIVGAIARFLLPGRDAMGCLATAILGIIGSVVGGFIGRLLFGARDGNGTLRPSFIMSVIGAVLVLWLWRKIQGKPSGRV
jgi:uncharacterized membrane protein YeaQ/YmgE (transglycosylase-associated protein family)